MKIAVPAEGPTLDSRVARVFGRCAFMLLVDSGTEEVVGCRLGGAPDDHGIRMARWICNHGARVLLTNSLGPRALEYLRARKVHIVAGVQGTVREVVEGCVNVRGDVISWPREPSKRPAPSGHGCC